MNSRMPPGTIVRNPGRSRLPTTGEGANLPRLSSRTLRELAAVIERQDPARKARLELTEAGVERLAEILMAGDRPTVGFYLNPPTERIRSATS